MKMTKNSSRPIAIHREGVVSTLWFGMLGWSSFFFVAALVSNGLTDEQKRQVAQNPALYGAMERFTLSVAAGGLVAGSILVLLAAFLASRRSDLNECLPDNPFTRGQLILFKFLILAGICLGLVLTLWLAPLVAPAILPLRDEQGRAWIGGIAGLLGGSLIHGRLFQSCRL